MQNVTVEPTIRPGPPSNRRTSDQEPEGDNSAVESASENGSEHELQNNESNGDGRARKRKRSLTVSCELCKQRKVKCDRVQPTCGWCARNGQLCEYKERRKPGLRAGYGKQLEQRLDRLEEIIQAQGRLIEVHLQKTPNLTQGTSRGGPLSYTSPSEPSAAPAYGSPSVPIAQDMSPPVPAHKPVASIAGLSDGSVPSTRPVFMQNAFSRTGSAASSPNDGQNSFAANESSLRVPMKLYSDQERSLGEPNLDLPPYDLLYALVDLYFERINTWCPILHRRTTLDTFFGPSPIEEEDRVVLYAIVATTLRFSTDGRLNAQNRQRYHDASKQKVLLYGLENSSVKALQALVILAVDLVGSSNGPPGWKLLALITRSVGQLGLTAEPRSSLVAPVYPSIYTLRAVTLPDADSWIEDESRRRLFWMVYVLDRYSTFATAFDFALNDKDIDRKLPCKDEYFTKGQPVQTRRFHYSSERAGSTSHMNNVGCFGLYIEVLGIFSRIHTFLKQPVDIGALSDVERWQATYRELDNELTSWEFNLPPEYAYENSSRLLGVAKEGRTAQSDWVQLHVMYQTAIIRLHSAAAYPTTRSPIFTPSYSASQRCLLAVNNVVSLTRLVAESNGLDRLGPPFAFSLWVCARLLLVHGSTIAHTVSPDIILFVDTLTQMAKSWKVAERYSEILQRVLDEYNEYQRSTSTDGERIKPSSVKILADMRRCAFDLDFLISQQPRSVPPPATDPHGPMEPPLSPTNPMLARNFASNDFEYLDVFGFFNVPRVPLTSDWARFQGMADAASTPAIDQAVDRPIQTGGNTTTASTRTYAASNANGNANEFNITNYLIPTPETDWLFQPGG